MREKILGCLVIAKDSIGEMTTDLSSKETLVILNNIEMRLDE